MNNKRGQLKIQEMSFMLIAVFLFFVLAGLFAVSILYSGLQKDAISIEERKAYAIITNLAGSAEFTFGRPNSIDSDKVIAMVQNPDYRFFWPSFASLRIISESGLNKPGELVGCTMATYPNCDEYVIFDRGGNGTSLGSFISLCRIEKESGSHYTKCEIGKIEIEVRK